MDKKALYFEMLRIRKIEEAIAEKYHEKKMRCPVHLSVGQEAVAVGVCASLDKNDYCVSAHRSHAHILSLGSDIKKLFSEVLGKESGHSKGLGCSMHLQDLKKGFNGKNV